jgi:hypothetical protein
VTAVLATPLLRRTPSVTTQTTLEASATPTIFLRQDAAVGAYVADPAGRTLHLFTQDETTGQSVCTGDCANAWPPFVADGPLTLPGARRCRSTAGGGAAFGFAGGLPRRQRWPGPRRGRRSAAGPPGLLRALAGGGHSRRRPPPVQAILEAGIRYVIFIVMPGDEETLRLLAEHVLSPSREPFRFGVNPPPA